MLKLERNLLIFDTETHDLGPPHRLHIVELGFILLYPDGREPKVWQSLFKPPKPITAGATGVHGITNDDVADAPRFIDVAQNLGHGFKDCDYCGYNVKFDVDVFKAEMTWCQQPWSYDGAKLVDPLKLWQHVEPRKLENAVRRWAKREPTQSHRADADARDAYDTLLGLLTEVTHLPRTPAELHALCFKDDTDFVDPDRKFIWQDKTACFNFGKWKGTPIGRVPASYLTWMVESGDFSPSVKTIISSALRGELPRRP